MRRRPGATDRVHTSTLGVRVLDRDDGVWVILRGEADIATLAELEAALARVELDVPGPVHLDVTELTFADVATIRSLATFARGAARTGHGVRTYGSGPTLRKVATILGFDTDLGIL
ncbi:STAS domain-containing protein [Nocardioides taihuensis]|uniref:STAS domain-containing protein n=1 Tax=Nocardioides taihuensis TaxID=1835606 RepID=A0ABW0BMU3_9ACTN